MRQIVKLGSDKSINYTMEITPMGNGSYRCYAYALCHGVKLEDWEYIALSLEEAHEDLTKDYLLQNLRRRAINTLKLMSFAYFQFDN